jgi:hypothetical protein
MIYRIRLADDRLKRVLYCPLIEGEMKCEIKELLAKLEGK